MASDYTLSYGPHATSDDGRCAMEWVSYLAGEPHSDEPACVSQVLRAFCTTLNDSLDDQPRQLLRPYLTRTIGTAGDGLDEARSWMALDWLIRLYTPAWLGLAQQLDGADALASLEEVTGSRPLRQALAALNEIRHDTRVRWTAGRQASLAGAWTPAAAGRAAAREAAWSSAGAAAWSAARVAVGDIAGDRARAMARDIAGDAAATAVRATRAPAGRAAAREAALAAITPTLDRLRRSAFELLDRMLPTVPVATPDPSSSTPTRERIAT